ncbi:MAG TPA: response regulator [Nitrospira sp.]|nr:response regulator [Nitrospira sp.]
MTAHPVTVLLIDEQKEDRASLRRRLLEVGSHVRVFEAASGDTGLDWVRTVQPDCIVIELRMRDVIGMEVLGRIQTELAGRRVPVVVWTVLNHVALRTTASALGVRAYVEKTRGSEESVVEVLRACLMRQQGADG